MDVTDKPRLVAHIDILGMSTLVKNDFPSAWGMLSDLISVRNNSRKFEYEFLDLKDSIKVFERIEILTFSDTLLLFTVGDSALEMRAMIILVAEIFHKALCQCVPVRAGIAHGQFWFNFDESMYAGLALVDAYEVGESSQWLGISLSDSVKELARAQSLRSLNHEVVVEWDVPIKGGAERRSVVNWPGIFAHDFTIEPPISVVQFYQAFEKSFGQLDTLPPPVANKYKNTVEFLNAMLIQQDGNLKSGSI